MSGGAFTLLTDVDALPLHDIDGWRAEIDSRLSRGARAVTLYGRRGDGDGEVVLTAVLESNGHLQVLRAIAERSHGYHELTSLHLQLHCFERELHEQTGLRIAGHPWLKPIRYQGKDQSAMDGYPFYRLDGKEVHEVAVGPVHAGVIEPGSFRFQCFGEQVHHLEIHLGYQHRGVEHELLTASPSRRAAIVETIAGDSSIAHATAHAAAIEALADAGLDEASVTARGIMLELERIAMHLAGLAGLATDIAFLQGASTYGRLRTTAINTSMRLCGSRFGRGAVRPGGVRLRPLAGLRQLLADNLGLLQRDAQLVDELFFGSRTVQHRLVSTGIVTPAQAQQLGLVGLAARSSGQDLDARRHQGGAYAALPMAVHRLPAGDCMARAQLRRLEIHESVAFLQRWLARADEWPVAPMSVATLAGNRLAIAVVEGHRGECVHCIETDAAGTVRHYKVQDPSLRNWMGLQLAVRDNEISDFPICNKSFDLSYCGNDL